MRMRCFTIVVVALVSGFTGKTARGQTDLSKLELGVQITAIRLKDITIPDPNRGFFFTRSFDTTETGFGGRLSYNLTRAFAIDGELNFFPRDDLDSGGRKFQGLLGFKAGHRSERFGLFGKARPGFVRFSEALDCPRGGNQGCDTFGKTDFALDVGGVVELYPSPRTMVRLDLGDTIIFYGEREFIIAVPEPGGPAGRRLPLAGDTKHNIQFSIGVGIRF